MMLSIDLAVSIPGFSRPIDGVAVETHSTFGGVRHFRVGIGAGGHLFAVYRGVEYRGEFFIQDLAHGTAAPPEALQRIREALSERFLAEWQRPLFVRKGAA